MRVTNSMLSQNLLHNLETSQEKIDKLQNQLATGLKISKPSDDPAGIQNAMKIKTNISSVGQWKSNADSALDYMNTEDSTLGTITSMLQRVKDLAVEGATGTLSTSDMGALADEVDQIKEQLQATANTQVGSKYIFSGTATDKELIPTDGSTSQANGNPVNFQIGDTMTVDISVNGQELFGDDSTGIMATLTNLSAGLRSGDSDAINTAMTNTDNNINNVIAMRTDLGARVNRIQAIQSQLDNTSTNLQDNLSSIQDADAPTTIVDLQSQENVYKAALSVGSQIIQPSLVDFMN